MEERGHANRSAQAPINLSERFALLLVAFLALYCFLRNFVFAGMKPFWYDEVCTWIVSKQPSAGGIWSVLEQSADSNPPVFYFLERWMAHLSANELVGYRIPAMLGVSVVPLCVFFFLRQRVGCWRALLAALIPTLSVLFVSYGTEARPYGLVAGCVALALLSYQRAESLLWTLALCLSLALAISLHYYSVFLFVPFGIAEAAFGLANKRVRWRVWLAMALGTTPLWAFLPLLLRFRQNYGGASFIAPATFFGALRSYGSFFNINHEIGVALSAALFLAVLRAPARSENNHRENAQSNSERAPIQERILAACLLALPFIVFVIAKPAQGGLLPRYVLAAILGIAVTCGMVLPQLGRTAVNLIGAVIVLAFATQEGSFWLAHARHQDHVGSPSGTAVYLAHAITDNAEPIVISDVGEYVEMVHSGPPEATRRFAGLVDPFKAAAYAGTDTLDKNVLILRRFAPLRVYVYSDFTRQYHTFYLHSNGSAYDWWPSRLAAEGHELKLLSSGPHGTLYRVTLRDTGM